MRGALRISRRGENFFRNRRARRPLVALLCSLAIGSVLSLADSAAAPKQERIGANWRLDMLRYLNAAREQHGLAPLRLDNRLNRAAQLHATNMVRRDFFDHRDPDGARMTDRADAFGYRWISIMENIAGGHPTAPEAIDGWMNSPDHRAAILNIRVRDAGVGYSYAPNDWGRVAKVHYWTLLVGRE